MPGDQRVSLKSVAPVSSAELASGRVRTGLRRDLTTALKARDRVAIAALRSVLAAIENAEAPAIDQSGSKPSRASTSQARSLELAPQKCSAAS